MAMADTGAQGAYIVGHSDLPVRPPAESIDEVLDGACNGAVSRTRGTEVSRESITFADQPGRFLTFEGTQLGRQYRAQVKVFLAGRRLYQAMWLGPPDNEPTDEIAKFFDSFALTGVVDSEPSLAAAGQPSSGTPVDETRRKAIYRDVAAQRRMVEQLTERRDRLAGQGGNTTGIDAQIENLQNAEESRLQTIARRHRITREQLDEIINEGDANGWSSP
jgi:hypothetical protein